MSNRMIKVFPYPAEIWTSKRSIFSPFLSTITIMSAHIQIYNMFKRKSMMCYPSTMPTRIPTTVLFSPIKLTLTSFLLISWWAVSPTWAFLDTNSLNSLKFFVWWQIPPPSLKIFKALWKASPFWNLRVSLAACGQLWIIIIECISNWSIINASNADWRTGSEAFYSIVT